MSYSVSVDQNSMVAHLTRSNCEAFWKLLYIQQNGNDENGNVMSECEEDEVSVSETDWLR